MDTAADGQPATAAGGQDDDKKKMFSMQLCWLHAKYDSDILIL
jgi:hypothetical protein